jgi:hypothetical protein
MIKLATRLLTLAIFAMPLVLVPMVTPAKAAASSGKHVKKHKRNIYRGPGFGDPWSAGRARPFIVPSSPSGPVCPGNARGIDCRRWPPPMEDDPDRKVSGSDAG